MAHATIDAHMIRMARMVLPPNGAPSACRVVVSRKCLDREGRRASGRLNREECAFGEDLERDRAARIGEVRVVDGQRRAPGCAPPPKGARPTNLPGVAV